ncbi:MAG: enoyl-CoA hydratase/isomerase family protein [Deltaproteobacteria bacterium]|nr:enoyl-CoA hydratase/isomerase family protein [Deltaproteobacteria bacterium]
MPYDNIKMEKKDFICTITIDHPPVNAWNMATMLDFEKAVNDVENDKDVRVVIITGAGDKCFSAGFDVSDAGNSHITSPKGCEVWTKLDRFSKPVIAAINGFAMGGGLELALSCHFRIMVDAPKAMVGLTELNLGIIPGWGGTQRLMNVVGKAKALDMILFSKRLSAQEALEIGLINRISSPEHLMDDALALAQKLAKRPPIAVACVLRAMSAGAYEGIDKGLEMEREGAAIVAQSKDRIEGFNAFLEKREPVFSGE